MRSFISLLERDIKNPTIKTFLRLCQVLKKEPWEMIKKMSDEKETCVILINDITHEAIIEDPVQRVEISEITGRDYVQMRDIPMLKERYELRTGTMHGVAQRLFYCPEHQDNDTLAANCKACGKKPE